jgi:biotin carboxylase
MKHILFIETNTTGTGAKAMNIAKQKGYKVHFWTSDTTQYDSIKINNPLDIADEILTIDTYDTEKMMLQINNSEYVFNGVLAFDDYHLIPAANIAENLKLPAPNIESLKLVRYKHLMRTYLYYNNKNSLFKQPEFLLVDDHTNVDDISVKFPCVLKPVDDSGSNGVTICYNKNELKVALQDEFKRNKNERGYSLERKWLIEEFIQGPEYSAEMLYTPQGWKLISVTKKDIYGNHAVESGHVTSTNLDPVGNLEESCIQLLSTFNLQFGATHIEFIVKDNKPYLVEVNPRLAGDCIPDLVEMATGIDMVEAVLNQALSESSEIKFTASKYAAIQFCMPDELGNYVEVHNIEAAKKVPGVAKIHTINLPFEVKKVSSSYHRLGYVISEGQSAIEASTSAKSAASLLKYTIKHKTIPS